MGHLVMAKAPTTQLTLKRLRADGYTAEVVEKWIPGANIRKDLFGFVDVLGVKPGETLAVQTTSAKNANDRLKKIHESEHLPIVLAAGWTIEVHGWEKVKNRWTLTKHFQLAKEVENDGSRECS